VQVVLTERTAIDLVHGERRARGGGKLLEEGALPAAASTAQEAVLARIGGGSQRRRSQLRLPRSSSVCWTPWPIPS
jgi:hypothetical protein